MTFLTALLLLILLHSQAQGKPVIFGHSQLTLNVSNTVYIAGNFCIHCHHTGLQALQVKTVL